MPIKEGDGLARLNRRSFFMRVAGAAATFGSLSVVTQPARAQPVGPSAPGGATGLTDNDIGAYADPVNSGRGSSPGETDNDVGATADAVGAGRGPGPRTELPGDQGPTADGADFSRFPTPSANSSGRSARQPCAPLDDVSEVGRRRHVRECADGVAEPERRRRPPDR